MSGFQVGSGSGTRHSQFDEEEDEYQQQDTSEMFPFMDNPEDLIKKKNKKNKKEKEEKEQQNKDEKDEVIRRLQQQVEELQVKRNLEEEQPIQIGPQERQNPHTKQNKAYLRPNKSWIIFKDQME